MAKVFISPSTQRSNAYAGGSTEMVEMRKVRDHLVPMLQAAGHEVRTGDWVDDINSPVRAANSWGADYYLAIHSNATGGAATARGVSMHIFGRGGTAERLANAIINEASKLSPVRTSGVQVNNFYEVRATRMPAVLSENDFHDNPNGSAWIKTNHRTIAIWHARGLCRLAGGSDALERFLSGGSNNQPKPTPPSGRVYRITANVLNVRSGPGTNYRINQTVKRGEAYTIVEVQGDWGRLKSGAGWIHLGYAQAI